MDNKAIFFGKTKGAKAPLKEGQLDILGMRDPPTRQRKKHETNTMLIFNMQIIITEVLSTWLNFQLL